MLSTLLARFWKNPLKVRHSCHGKILYDIPFLSGQEDMNNETILKCETGENSDSSWITTRGPLRSPAYPFIAYEPDLFDQEMMPKTLHWSIPWADLMMTMFILFAVLFVYHASNHDTEYMKNPTAESDLVVASEAFFSTPEPRKNASKAMSELYEIGRRTLRADDLKDIASVELVQDKAVRIILTGDVFFDTGKADLKPGGVESLHKLSEILKETPHAVNVVGHTDDVPIHTDRFPSNWELSTARACKTARFLIDNMGLSPNQIYVSGHAEYQPVRPNDTPIGRLANRRVEIIISKEKPLSIPQT